MIIFFIVVCLMFIYVLVIIYVYFIHARNLYALHCGLAAQMSTLSSAKATEREVLLLQYSTVVSNEATEVWQKGTHFGKQVQSY